MKLSARHAFHVIAASFLLAACNPQDSGAPDDSNAPQSNAPEIATPPRDLWTVSQDSVGPFEAGTHLDMDMISALVPEYDVRSGTRSREGEDYATLLLFRDNAAAPSVELVEGDPAGTISEIIIYEGGRVAVPQADIGTRFADSGFAPSDCWPGVESWSGLVVCYTSEQPQFGYWFNPAPYSGPDGELPPADVLDDARVTMLRWWSAEGR